MRSSSSIARTSSSVSSTSACVRPEAGPYELSAQRMNRSSDTGTRANVAHLRIARIFNTYGPRMHENDGRVVSNFVVQALAG